MDKKNNLYKIILIDIFLLICALLLAHLIRFEFNIPSRSWKALRWAIIYILLIKMACFYLFDLYRGMFRYTSISDLINIIKASSFSSLLIISFLLFSPRRFIGFSRSVFIIDWCLTILFISGFRLGIRFYFESVSSDQRLIDIIRSFMGPLNRKKPGILNLMIIGGFEAVGK
jgi:FlaA1/EpsC-like NDP-sugar epimerase